MGTGSWFASHGIQNVLFAWLVTIVLNEPPSLVGLAQLALLLPATLFMLIGGSLADRLGGKRVAVVSQTLALVPLLALALVLFNDSLSFAFMIGYAVSIGCLQAFVTPARDSMLNTVAEGNIQRTVTKVTLIQFIVQMIGFVLAGFADTVGGALIVATQSLIVLFGALALGRLPQVSTGIRLHTEPLLPMIMSSITAGFQTVWSNRSMRLVVTQNVAMGICFMGSYVVTIPLLIRDRYDGSSEDLALVNLVNSSGLVLTILVQLFLREIRHKGNALLLAHGLGAVVLAFASLGFEFWFFLILMFIWGSFGGVAMATSRTIMQEQAPNDQRGSVMSFFSFSFMGAGPVGALLWGFMIEYIGPQATLFIACTVMFFVVLLIARALKR
ncbi:MAG: MFS transporter [Gammaproteobacteria bacterium]|nr:MFS transporter [Gammaproteobacteria bacterium]